MPWYGYAALLAVFLAYSFYLEAGQKNPRGFTSAQWRKMGGFILVVSTIVGAELLLPSTRMTGLTPPARTEPARHIDALAWSPVAVTYNDLSEQNPWAWSLGFTNRADIERRITRDLALAQAPMEESLNQVNNSIADGRIAGVFLETAANYAIFIDGLTRAADDLDRLFAKTEAGSAPRVTVTQADAFIATHIQTAAEAERAASDKARNDTQKAVADYILLHNITGTDTADEIQAELTRLQFKASLASFSAYSPLYEIADAIRDIQQRESDISPTKPLPDFDTALPVFEQQLSGIANQVSQLVPVPVRSLTTVMNALEDAVTGYQRSAPMTVLEHRCVLGVDPATAVAGVQVLCEAAVPLPINYDLTAKSCGQLNIQSLCRESWIFPHLNVVYSKDSFTVHAPRPIYDPRNGPALTQWTAIWNGVEHALTPSATFPWDGSTSVLANLGLRHKLAPNITSVHVWQDYRNALFFPVPEEYTFQPVDIPAPLLQNPEDTAPLFMALGEDRMTDLNNSDRRMPRIKRAITDRQIQLAFLSAKTPHFAQKSADPTVPFTGFTTMCVYRRPTYGSYSDETKSAALNALISRTNGSACDAIIAYAAILDSIKRSTLAGTWFWMLSLDRSY